jgi:peptidoglycan hydrolase-like protein with peptidoglycan-binding domain
VAALVLALAAGGVIVTTHYLTGRGGATLTSKSSRHHDSGNAKDRQLGPDVRLQVISISPSNGRAGVAFDAAVIVRFSTNLAAHTALPKLDPPVPGHWSRVDRKTLEFTPSGFFVPYAKESVNVPATTTSARGTSLGRRVTSAFRVKGPSVLRLQELLAELGYLPLSFTPTGQGAVSANSVTTRPAATSAIPGPPCSCAGGLGADATAPLASLIQEGVATSMSAAPTAPPPVVTEPRDPYKIDLAPRPGVFRWRFGDIPPSLAGLWATGQPNEITTGAVMEFEDEAGLAVDGSAGPQVWKALLRAVAERHVYTASYNYVFVSEGSPEYVTLWRDGTYVFRTLANTGIPVSPTAAGTWPVFARYIVTTMSGTNPDGTHYSDPGIPWTSYFHGGDALHGFIRSGYGWPQSLGCVEMPFEAAHAVFPYTPLGTLVTVE